MKLKKTKEDKSQVIPVNQSFNNDINLKNIKQNKLINSSNVQKINQNQILNHQQQQNNQKIIDNKVKAIQNEYWNLYRYYCAKFSQYCRKVTNSYQDYINNMIRSTVQQSLHTNMNQAQLNGNGNNNPFSELNSSLSSLLYYKLIDNLVNNNNNNYQPVMLPQYVNHPSANRNFNPAQYGYYPRVDNQNQQIRDNLMTDHNNFNNFNNTNRNDANVKKATSDNLDGNTNHTDNDSISLLSPEITNRFRDKLDKILAQQTIEKTKESA